MFLAAFPLPIVSQLPGSSPHAASPATCHHLEVLCHVCILISPMLTPKGLSCVSAVGGYSCPALSHTHPMGLIPGVGKATLHSLPSPTQHLLVHSPRVFPALSQTLTSLHVLVPSWKPFTMVVHKASLLPPLGPRDPCSERPGGLWMHS